MKMNKLTKGQKRNIINEIRYHENMIAKLEKALLDDERTIVLLNGTKTIHEIVNINSTALSSLRNKSKATDGLKVMIEHIRCGNKIVCTMKYLPRNITVEGVAICAEDDKFDTPLGMTIAEYRATAKFFDKIAEVFGK